MEDDASSRLLTTSAAVPMPSSSSASAAVVVVSPMELPGSARPTFSVHPLLFYRHCFRLTSQNDRVARVLVMSEHYVAYLCAPDGRATWSFHPTTVRTIRVLPSKDQALFSFVHHATDLLLHFDEKLSSDRVNPKHATLSYFVYLLCREHPTIVVTEEEDHRCLAQSRLVKARNQNGAEGFVRRLVDGLRGYYLVLKAQVDEVREQFAAQSDRQVAQSLSSLVGQRLRRPTMTARQAPLSVRPVAAISNPLGAICVVAPRSEAHDPRFVAVDLASEAAVGIKDALGFAADNDTTGSNVPPLIVFYRRNVAVTVGHADVLTTPSFLDRVGVLGDRDAGGAASPATSHSLPQLHPSTRTGDLFVDGFGVVYFVPSDSIGGGHASQNVPDPQRSDVPATTSALEAGVASCPHRPSTAHRRCEVVMLLGRIVDVVVKQHRWVRSSNGDAAGSASIRRQGQGGGATVAECTASKYNRFTLGSVVAAMSIPPLLPKRTATDGGGRVRHDHDGRRCNDDGGECPARSPLEHERAERAVDNGSWSTSNGGGDAQHVLQHYFEQTRAREQGTSLSAWRGSDDGDSDDGQGAGGGGVDATVTSSALGWSALDKRATVYAAAQRAHAAATRRAQRRLRALDEGLPHATVVTVIDFDATSASRMAATDGDVSSLETFAKLVEVFRRHPAAETAFGANSRDVKTSGNQDAAVAPPPTSSTHGPTKVLVTGKDMKGIQKAERAERRKAAAAAQHLEASVARLKGVEAFLDAKSSLEEATGAYGTPWGRMHPPPPDAPTSASTAAPPSGVAATDGVVIGRSRQHADAALRKLIQLVCARNDPRQHAL